MKKSKTILVLIIALCTSCTNRTVFDTGRGVFIMREIPLSGKHGIGKFALVDDEDYEELSKYKWHARFAYCTFYAIRREETSDGKIIAIPMHRQILGITNPKIFIDHKNRYGLDNQKHNIRIATPSQNLANRAPFKNKTSQYKGVSYHYGMHKWIANIGHNKKLNHLGYFSIEEDAALAYNEAAVKFHGEYAYLNIIV